MTIHPRWTCAASTIVLIGLMLSSCQGGDTRVGREPRQQETELGTDADGGAPPPEGVAKLLAESRFCSATAQEAFDGCRAASLADAAVRRGVCINAADEPQREKCLADAEDAVEESNTLCTAQRKARREVCRRVGEARYEPSFAPAAFETDFARPRRPNRYFPIAIGNRWEYRGSELVTVEVTSRTKLIAGVTCIVVRDRVTVDGEVVEDTDDWFALAKDGTVFYCGEEVKDYASFEGDAPRRPELVAIDGSFKVGRDGDKTGTVFLASPRPGTVYRQEFSLQNAEDIAEVLSTTYGIDGDSQLDRFVPRALAEHLCGARDCVVTKETSPLDPEAHERKYYAPDVGVFLSVDLVAEEITQLVDCNMSARCKDLPAPTGGE